MKPEPKLDPKKAQKHEAKGDKLVSKKKYREAMGEYRQSETLDPDRVSIYDKLIETQNQLVSQDWREEDFTDSMTWTMRRQELQNPRLRFVHQTLSVEYREIYRLLQSLMAAPNEELESTLIDKILAYGENASLPTLHFLLSIKALATQSEQPAENKDPLDPTP